MVPTITTDGMSWNISINQPGDYNITIRLGEHQEDWREISRIVSVS